MLANADRQSKSRARREECRKLARHARIALHDSDFQVMQRFRPAPEIERLITASREMPGLGPRSARRAALSC